MAARDNIPGSLGLPYIGETLAFINSPFHFLDEHQARYGNVFKSRLLGRNTVFLAGLAGAEAFYNDDNISRTDAHPPTLVDLFGGINMEMYDGPRHHDLKTMALAGFNTTAIAGYLPAIQDLVESTLARLASRSRFSAVAELRRLAIEAICLNVMGLDRGPDTDAITADYGTVVNGLVSLPVPLPFMDYGKARAARDRLLARIRAVIAERRRRPGSDALSTMLTGQALDGRVYTDEEAVLEVHHVVIAGFIVYALMAEAMLQMAQQPDLHRRCSDEVAANAARGPLTMAALDSLPVTMDMVRETKRTQPLVPVAFGRAARTFECEGISVPENWRVYLALWLNSHDPAIYHDPATFDPGRFGTGRAEHLAHPLAFIPQGAEPPDSHRCLGLDYSTYLALAFITLLLRDYEWSLPEQNRSLNWRKLPPEQRDGLQVELRRR